MICTHSFNPLSCFLLNPLQLRFFQHHSTKTLCSPRPCGGRGMADISSHIVSSVTGTFLTCQPLTDSQKREDGPVSLEGGPGQGWLPPPPSPRTSAALGPHGIPLCFCTSAARHGPHSSSSSDVTWEYMRHRLSGLTLGLLSQNLYFTDPPSESAAQSSSGSTASNPLVLRSSVRKSIYPPTQAPFADHIFHSKYRWYFDLPSCLTLSLVGSEFGKK